MDLKYTYKEIQKIFKDVEPFESVKLVEEYRQYWKPEKVKTILLAESHVFTDKNDMNIQLKNIDMLRAYPKQYSKFVYCLGYGEKNLTQDASHPKRDGTPQFWKIFYSCINNVESNECFEPIQSSTRFEDRLKNKINILQTMRERGIWLVDTSIVALYKNGKKPKNMPIIIEKSWNNYTKKVILEANPENIIVIGKGVARSIESSLKDDNLKYTVIAQPNAHLSSDEHLKNFKNYYRLCNTNQKC